MESNQTDDNDSDITAESDRNEDHPELENISCGINEEDEDGDGPIGPIRQCKKRKRAFREIPTRQHSEEFVISDTDDDDLFVESTVPCKRRKTVTFSSYNHVRKYHTNSSVPAVTCHRQDDCIDGDSYGGYHVQRRKRQRIQDLCAGDEIIEESSWTEVAEQPSTGNTLISDVKCYQIKDETSETSEDSDDGMSPSGKWIKDDVDRKDPIVAELIRANATAIKQEGQHEEWVYCLQWLSHVGLGKHCGKLASLWKEDEIDFSTLKRLNHDDLVWFCVLPCAL